MKYITLFENHSEYEDFVSGGTMELPNVSHCIAENEVHYNPIETRLIGKFNVTSTENPTKILNYATAFTSIEIDGIEQPDVVTSYTFSTTGEHTVKYTLADETNVTGFHSCFNLTAITIPNSVTKIGSSAFRRCSGLTSVDIPTNVTTIENYAFYECKGLTSIDIPNNVTTLSQAAFGYCTNATSLTISNNLTTIPQEAFTHCTKLTSVEIPNGVLYIRQQAFYYCI